MMRTYPDRPWLGVGGVAIDGDRVLLVRRGNEPFLGFWSIPGGIVETGETLADAVRREMREETGLLVEPIEVVHVFESIRPDESGGIAFHFVVIDYLCRVVGGQLAAADDVLDARWFERGKLPEPITDGAPGVIENAFGSLDG
jgi:ADP-ribose pyrophosphatase YjhB (NUDIX family)